MSAGAVHVSMIGFDNGEETSRELNGHVVDNIHPDLTSGLNVTVAKKLKENARPQSKDMRGFWLIRPDGSRPPVTDYFIDLWNRQS